MPYRFLEDIALADIAFEVREKTLEGLFAGAAEALLQTQIENPEAVRRGRKQTLNLSHEKLDLLLYRFLQELIFFKDSQKLLLQADRIQIEQKDGRYTLNAQLSGETLDPERHEQRVDVKAVTLHQFEVTPTQEGWKATVILDI